ncbi:ribonuclease H-like domain-containing protein [Tanacetum coccineum]
MEEETHPEGTGSLTHNHEEMASGSKTDSNSDTKSTPIIADFPVQNLKRSSRTHKLPAILNEFVVDSKVKYGVERVVNYSNLTSESFCFVSALNKSIEPRTYKEAILDDNWVNDMNKEIKALNKNHTWNITELPSAPRKWNEKLVGILRENGFVQSCSDHSLFTKTVNNIFVALLVYVDDIVITGIEFIKQGNDIYLSQRKYCLELLHEFSLLACKPVSIPMEANIVLPFKLSHDNPYLDNITGYQKLVGKLIYLTHTRPDISYSTLIGLSARRLENPFQGIMSFITETSFLGKARNKQLSQISSTEAEYRSLGSASCEIIWILKIMKDLKVKINLPVSFFCDNKAALQLAVNLVFHERSKHFEIDVHFI